MNGLLFDGPREPVVIERGDPANGEGLPRPLAPHDGVLRPVPWTNRDDGWGLLHDSRASLCEERSLCLVCGEAVESGFIFTGNGNCPVPAETGDLRDCASDSGPLHERCAKMTIAHCAHMRDSMRNGTVWMVRYCRHTA